MKKFYKSLILVSVGLMVLTGCGKKSGSISENLINDDPTAIDMTGSIIASPVANEDGIVTDMIPEEEEVTGLYTSPEESESVSSDTVSENDMPSVSESAVVTDSAALSENEAQPEETTTVPVYEEQRSDKITVVNITGTKLEHVYITLSAGNINDMDVLGADVLKDGDTFVYALTGAESLYSARDITLNVRAVTSKDKEIVFDEVRVYDPDNMIIVLSGSEKDGYYVYLEQ